MDDPMHVARGISIPLAEVELRTSRSSGPGGQHANVTASRVEAIFDVAASAALDDDAKRRITARYGPVVRAVAQDTRSQLRNRELALERLRDRLAAALHVQRARHATKPSRSARRKRVDVKKQRSETKRQRRRPGAGEY